MSSTQGTGIGTGESAVECIYRLGSELVECRTERDTYKGNWIKGCLDLDKTTAMVMIAESALSTAQERLRWTAQTERLQIERAQRAEAERDALKAAAQAVVDRWDTPLWKDVEPTAVVINRLRSAIDAAISEEAATGAEKE